MNKHLLPGAALMGLVSGGAGAATIGTFPVTASTANPAPAGSTGVNGGPLGPFNPIGSPTGIGGIGGPISFTAPFAGTLVMKVGPQVLDEMPVGFTGEVYQAFVDGASLGLTSQGPLFGPDFSTGTFTASIPAGTNTFDINDQLLSYIGQPPPYGSDVSTVTQVPSSFSPGSLMVTLDELPSAVPEPSTLALFGTWLLGLGFLLRWRKAR